MSVNKKRIYWLCQIIGWSFFGLVLITLELVINGGLALRMSLASITLVGVLISISHGQRYIIIRNDWLNFDIPKVIPRIALIGMLSGLIIQTILFPVESFLDFTFPVDETEQVFNDARIGKTEQFIAGSITYTFLLIIWSVFYYLGHFFDNFRKEEMKNLQWEAKISEIELNKLKSQLNPHFMFNSMNGIRALVDEDPIKAKKSITKLSNILRNTLVMNKKKVIPFEEELRLVYDYLDLEGIRLEERLQTTFDVSGNTGQFFIPPLMLQTLVENAIKHGISTLAKGGQLSLTAKIKNEKLEVTLCNSGQLKANFMERINTFGLANTQQRLHLLYGKEASFHISNLDSENVEAKLILPRNTDLALF